MKPCTLYVDTSHWRAGDAAGVAHGGPRGTPGDATQPVLQEAGAWLEALGPRRRSLAVLLSHACVPSLTLPWSARAPLAGEVARRVHEAWRARDVLATSHDIRIHWPDHGMPVVSLAYPRELLKALATQLAPHRVSSVECSVFACAARQHAQARDPRGLLLFAEADGYSALHLEGGRLMGAEHLPPGGRGLDALPVWLRRKALEYPGEGEIRWPAGEGADAARLCGAAA